MAETIPIIDRSNNLAVNTLLSTKLFIPQARHLQDVLPRPRLIEQLQTGLSCPLTLISAPAGFGKTTLLTEWIPHSDCCVCWLSLDEADNDLTRFLTYFIAALQRLKVDFGQAILAVIQTSQPPPVESLMTALVNEIVQTLAEFALVLDDYHLLHLPVIHGALAFLLSNLPPNMHLIITSRSDPPLPLARLRARRQLTEIRATELRFTPDEAAAFLNEVMGLKLSAADIAALETRTEGWIAGLQLAALSMRGRRDLTGFIQAFTGSHIYVVDYLTEEVLQRQPENVQTFLLQTSLLDRLNGSLCNAVTGRSDGQAILEQLQQHNLFIIPLDDERKWYRYHHLFAELLHTRLGQAHPDTVGELHRRASSWYEQAGLIDEAVHHALAAQAFDRAATLVEQVAPAMIQYSELARLLSWLGILPADEIRSRPLLGLYYAWSLFLTGQIQPAVAHLEAVEALLEADETNQTPEVQGHAAAMRAYLVRETGDLAATIALSRQALTYLPEQDSLLRAMVTLNLAIAHYLQGEFEPASDLLTQTIATGQTAQRMANTLSAIYLNMQLLRGQGSLQQALQRGQEGLALVARHGWHNFPAVGFLYMAFGDLLRERNELSMAAEYLEKGIILGQAGGHPHILIGGHVWLAWLRQTEGNATGSQEAIRAALQLVQQHEVSRFWPLPSAACTQVRLWIAQGNLAAASRWAQTSDLDQAQTLIPYLDEAVYLTLARLRIAEGSLEVAESLLMRLHQAAASARRRGSLIEILILQAVTYAARKQSEKAMSALAQALSLAEPEGYIRVFVDEGAPMAALLHEAHTRGVMPAYVTKLLAAFPDLRFTTSVPEAKRSGISDLRTEDRPIVNRKSEIQNLIEPLSKRELEILTLMAEGLTNIEIAQQIFVSPHTVKVHTRHIYEKLDVNSRRQAVSKARALGLLT